ncbi:C39 family peptidase [Streptococcus sp. DD13]|uniref:C39 family peptidase n=1 Tax=Streptococcus sp. DD13 TaxID=1777881 RepID=UPI000799D861|nr:C39 family peptidase [Streptococcus sp. DD13]KXT79259.1 putative surface protein [Streptococcus sp. DD13]
MRRKIYPSKKNWVVAGITLTGLLLAPSVLAEEVVPTTAYGTSLSPASDVQIPETNRQVNEAVPSPIVDNQNSSTEETSETSVDSTTGSIVLSKQSADTRQDVTPSNVGVTSDTIDSTVASSVNGSTTEASTQAEAGVQPTSTASAEEEGGGDQGHKKADTKDIKVNAHVQGTGWNGFSDASQVIGTVGKGKRLEALVFKLEDGLSAIGDIIYQSHVQDIGWQTTVKTGEMSGTVAKSKRLEAFNMRLTGELATYYDVYYRTHVQNVGWLGWAKNGGNAGTEGLSLRLEAIEVQLVSKEDSFQGDNRRSFIKKGQQVASISYRTYVGQNGWQTEVKDGSVSGSVGKNRRIEALGVRLDSDYFGHVSYQTHIQNVGWVPLVRDGQASGVGGSGKQVEAVKISLIGDISKDYDVYYRVHSQNKGWLGWTKNGSAAGTEGFSLGVEAVEVTLVKKGSKAPGTTANAFVKKQAQQSAKPKKYPMPYFNQRDARWISKYYGRYTMGDTGCVPTSLSMVFSSLTGKTIMPTAVADWLYHNTNDFDRTVPGTRAPGIVKAANAWGLKATNLSSYNHIVSALKSGDYVLAGVERNVFVNQGSHEIVLKGYNNGMVYVTDPYTQSLSGWYTMSYLFNTKSTDKDDTALGLPFFKISHS